MKELYVDIDTEMQRKHESMNQFLEVGFIFSLKITSLILYSWFHLFNSHFNCKSYCPVIRFVNYIKNKLPIVNHSSLLFEVLEFITFPWLKTFLERNKWKSY